MKLTKAQEVKLNNALNELCGVKSALDDLSSVLPEEQTFNLEHGGKEFNLVDSVVRQKARVESAMSFLSELVNQETR
jgi:hypothetical protein